MTPREALAKVLSDVSPPDPEWVASIADPPSVPSANWPGWADAVTAALEALGFTVAPVQDARDAEALRLALVRTDRRLIEAQSALERANPVEFADDETAAAHEHVSDARQVIRAALEGAR